MWCVTVCLHCLHAWRQRVSVGHSVERTLSRELHNIAEVSQHLWDVVHHNVHVGSDMLVLIVLS